VKEGRKEAGSFALEAARMGPRGESCSGYARKRKAGEGGEGERERGGGGAAVREPPCDPRGGTRRRMRRRREGATHSL